MNDSEIDSFIAETQNLNQVNDATIAFNTRINSLRRGTSWSRVRVVIEPIPQYIEGE